MSDFLTRLVGRAVGREPVVQPFLPSRYAPGASLPGDVHSWDTDTMREDVRDAFEPIGADSTGAVPGGQGNGTVRHTARQQVPLPAAEVRGHVQDEGESGVRRLETRTPPPTVSDAPAAAGPRLSRYHHLPDADAYETGVPVRGALSSVEMPIPYSAQSQGTAFEDGEVFSPDQDGLAVPRRTAHLPRQSVAHASAVEGPSAASGTADGAATLPGDAQADTAGDTLGVAPRLPVSEEGVPWIGRPAHDLGMFPAFPPQLRAAPLSPAEEGVQQHETQEVEPGRTGAPVDEPAARQNRPQPRRASDTPRRDPADPPEVGRRSAPAMPRAGDSPASVRVTIGRIEVRAVQTPPPAPPSQSTPAVPVLALDDYLKQRSGMRE